MSNNTLYAYDLDETLIHPGHLPRVKNTRTGTVFDIDSSMTYQLNADEVYDFSMFECREEFRKAKKNPIGFRFFNSTPEESHIIIVTARTSFISENDIKIDLYNKGFSGILLLKTKVFFVGDDLLSGEAPTTEEAKAMVISEYSRNYHIDEIFFYDDNLKNLEEVSKIDSKYGLKDVLINTIHM